MSKGVGEWRLGGLIRERFVGVRLSRWPENRSTEWVLSLHLGRLFDVTTKWRFPKRAEAGLSATDVVDGPTPTSHQGIGADGVPRG